MRAITAVAIWLALVGVAAAQDTTQLPTAAPPPRSQPVVTWGGQVDFVSAYVWRGLRYSEGRVVWPSAWVSARGFTATLFVNYDPAYDPKLNEYDVTVVYRRAVGRLILTGTYTRYAYFEGDSSRSTTELIARVAVAVGGGEIFTTHAFDVGEYPGAYYLEAGYAIERQLDAKSTLTADASVAFWSTFIEKYEGISGSTVGPVTVNFAYARQLAPHLSVRPHFTLSYIGDSEARERLNPPTATFGIAAVLRF